MQLTSPLDRFVFPAHHAPARGARRGGVVVIQEIFGVTDHIRAMCDRFAAAGYEALAPAMYERAEPGFEIKGAVTPDAIQQALPLVQKTPWSQVAADMQAAIDALTGPVFVTGFCWGGAAAWLAAQHCAGVAAASGFYGRAINDLLQDAPKAPVILHYGKNDAGIPLTAVDAVRAAHPTVPIYLYDAGHGFCREGGHDFNEAARDKAMSRTLDFFGAQAERFA
ncbi:MAG: dienelactone hydrolase family protein [Hyphomonadaceae bacterium]